jgi:hypothetical protein
VVQLGPEGLVVRLVDQIGFPGPLVTEAREDPPESLPQVGDVGLGLTPVLELAAQRLDAVPELLVLDPDPAHPVPKAGLGPGDVGEQAVRARGVLALLGGGVVETASDATTSSRQESSRPGLAASSAASNRCMASSVRS